jgi:2-polyprenyl-6-methoxyphenol hydroxylase-like FAD-dependent oxidoreductase
MLVGHEFSHPNPYPSTPSAAAVLIGDAAHGVLPMTGQGMNSALEDGVILAEVHVVC